MAATDAGWPADVEFVEYVQARQHTLLRAAYLVCGDAQVAEDLLQRALVTLARHWESVRDEQPDSFVRRTLYREVVGSGRSRHPETIAVVLAEDPTGDVNDSWDAEDAERRLDVMRALGALTPRQRATVVLRSLEDRSERDAAEALGCSVATVRSESQAALARLQVAERHVGRDTGGPRATTDPGVVRDLLELASDDLPEVDLAEAAWDQARRRHRTLVRRTVLGVGVVAAGALVTVVLRQPEPVPGPLPVPTTTGPVDGRLPVVEFEGVSVFMAPDPRSEGRLPPYPDADALALPRHLGPGPPGERATLGEGGLDAVPESVRAVFLVGADDGRVEPVLYVPGARVPYVVVPSSRLNQSLWEAQPLGARAISDDRHRVVFHEPGRIRVLDARDGSVVDVELPDPTLTVAGWARDGVTVVAWGRDAGWLIDPLSGAVERSAVPVHADWADLAEDRGSGVVRSFSGRGELTGSKDLRGQPLVPHGSSVSNTEGWVAGGAYLPEPYQQSLERSQALVAVQGDLRPTPRLLAATKGPLVPAKCYRPLAWGPRDVVLFESLSVRPGFQGTVRRVLAWDVIGGRLWHVADVVSAASGVGEFAGSYTV